MNTPITPAMREPPLDPGLPIIGHLREFIPSKKTLLQRLYQQHGPCFRIRLGGETIVVLAGPQMEELARKDGGRGLLAGPSNLPFVSEFGGHNMMLGADGEPHLYRRRQVMPQFTPGAVMKMAGQFANVAREMALSWCSPEPFEILPRLKRLVTRQTGLALVGRDSDEIHEDLCRFFDLAVAVAFGRVPRPVMRLFGYAKARRRVFAFAQAILDQRKTVPVDARPGDLVDLVLAAREPDGSPLDPGESIGLVLAPFVGGLDTVSHTLAFLVYEVLSNPSLYARCQAEADEVYDGDSLDTSRFKGLKTIHAAVQEALRCHSVTEIGQRTAAERFEFEGYTIEKGTKLMLAWTISNQLASRHADPDRFDVDRFLSPREESTAGIGAFGFGPHRCIGAKLGEVQIAVSLVAFLRAARMELSPENYQLKTSSYVALKPVDLGVRFQRRTQAPH